MNVGASQVDITPPRNGDLSGFVARAQPATGVHDPLAARALYFECNSKKLLWIHCDLIGFAASFVTTFRDFALGSLGLTEEQLLLTATHTHSGPATIQLSHAGEYDFGYEDFLRRKLREVARDAISRVEACDLVFAQGSLDLAVDRRKKPSAHTDPCVSGIGFRRSDGSFLAAILNYAIHPVALGAMNRMVSGDLFGTAAQALAASLSGAPVVLATNGACGNLNPPECGVSFDRMEAWGREIAGAIAPGLADAKPVSHDHFHAMLRRVSLPLDVLDPDAIERCAAQRIRLGPVEEPMHSRFREVVKHWRDILLAAWNSGTVQRTRDAELFVLSLGDLTFVGVNGEVFSQFTDLVRGQTGRRVATLGYANGNTGYISTRAAYAEGGYEVDVAHLYYGGYRFSEGALERLAENASEMIGLSNSGS